MTGKLGRTHLPTVLALLFGALYALQLYAHATRNSSTGDETAHVFAGYRHVACGDFAFNSEHPPLLKQVAALTLMGKRVVLPDLPCTADFTRKRDAATLGTYFLSANGVSPVLVPARLGASLFSLLLVIVLWLAARRMLGAWVGAIAVGLLALEPVMIAHGSLVTTDMIISVAAFSAMYALYRAPDLGAWARTIVVGLAFGFMLVAKHSAVVIAPGLVLAFMLDAFLRSRRTGAPVRRELAWRPLMLAASGAIALVVLWADYQFRYSALPGRAHAVEVGQFLLGVGRPGFEQTTSASILSLLGRLRIFPEAYWMGLADIAGSGDRPSMIFGTMYPTAHWFYFPVAFLVKSSLPLLLLFPLGIATLARQGKSRELLFLSIPPLAFFLVSLTSGINIGVRHILPVYPFLIVLAAAAFQALWRRGLAWRVPLALLLGCHAITIARVAPDYIAYANPLWGGQEKAYVTLSNSNSDWGQSSGLVAAYVAKHGIGRNCWFAGTGQPTLQRIEQPCRLLPGGQRWKWVDSWVPPPVPRSIEGTVFVGVRAIPEWNGPEYLPLLRAGPVKMLGGSVLVFEGRFDLPLAAAISHAQQADTFASLGKYPEALAEGRQAIELGPDDPRPHISYGEVLVALDRLPEAREHAMLASRLIRQRPGQYGWVRERLQALQARVDQPPR